MGLSACAIVRVLATDRLAFALAHLRLDFDGAARFCGGNNCREVGEGHWRRQRLAVEK
jgi:hypothetical protein